MFTLSLTTSYAIRALTFLAESDGKPQFIGGIAKAAGVPKAYLAKILPRLRAARIVDSKTGYTGGIWLSRKPEAITLFEISDAIEGHDSLTECILGFKICSERSACPIHEKWKMVRRLLRQELGGVTLKDLAGYDGTGKRRLPNRTRARRSVDRVKEGPSTAAGRK